MTVIVVTPPAVEPITQEEMRDHLGFSEWDFSGAVGPAVFDSKLTAARMHLERLLGMAFITQTLRVVVDSFPAGRIELPRRPVQSVTNIVYRNIGFESVTIPGASLRVAPLGSDAPTFVGLTAGAWPETAEFPGSVEVTFVAGYGEAPEHVPEPIREAIRMLAGHYFNNREATYSGQGSVTEIPMGVEDLILPYRRWSFG